MSASSPAMSVPLGSKDQPPDNHCQFCNKEGVVGKTLISTQALASEFQLHSPRRSYAIFFQIYNCAGEVLWEGESDRARNLLDLQHFLSFLEIIPSVIPITEDDFLIDGNTGRPITVNDGLILETVPKSGTATLTYARPGEMVSKNYRRESVHIEITCHLQTRLGARFVWIVDGIIYTQITNKVS